MNDLNLSIYVACLASYNNGVLHGAWIDVTQGEEAVQAEIQNMLAESEEEHAEEFAIFDFDFCGLEIHEYESIEAVCQKAEFIAEHGELGASVLSEFGDIETASKLIEDEYHGEWNSEKAFAEELFDEIYSHDLPDNLRYYIDYDAFARDLFINDYRSIEVGNQVHVFSNC